jgi:hypothetical protein
MTPQQQREISLIAWLRNMEGHRTNVKSALLHGCVTLKVTEPTVSQLQGFIN